MRTNVAKDLLKITLIITVSLQVSPTLSLDMTFAPSFRRSCKAATLPPLQAQWTAVASS